MTVIRDDTPADRKPTRDYIFAVVRNAMEEEISRIEMGQVMAECDCPRETECALMGRCMAEDNGSLT